MYNCVEKKQVATPKFFIGAIIALLSQPITLYAAYLSGMSII